MTKQAPADNVHIQLHVHHIRPWACGGLTADENLITLCHTCHVGLEPHEDHALYDLIGVGELGQAPDAHNAGVLAYRELIEEAFNNVSAPATKRSRKAR